MLDDIRFTRTAVAKKAYVQELTHFLIKDGRITGFNGAMALSSSIALDINARPNAAKFMAAIAACEGTIALHVTGAGRLAVRAAGNGFKAFVDCLQDDGSYYTLPEGDEVQLGDAFFKGLARLAPAMSIDASRPWAMGIKVRGEVMYATNNVIVVQYWHGCPFPHDVVIPAAAVDELLRIGTAPTKVQVCQHSVTFWFGPDRWLKTNLLDGSAWPLDRLDGALDSAPTTGLAEFPKGFFDSIDTLKPFLGDEQALYLRCDCVCTSPHDGEGASVDAAIAHMVAQGEMQSYSFTQMQVLGQVATHANLETYPAPCRFGHATDPLRGLIIGRRM